MLRLDDVVDGRALAVARIGVGVSGLLNCLEGWVKARTIIDSGSLRVPSAEWVPLLTTGSAGATAGLGACAALFLVVGLGTRPAAAALAAALGAMVLLEQQTYSNHLALTMWCALWLTASRSDARWSLRARISGARDVRIADQVLLMTQLSVVYAFTGALKVNPEFLSGRVIQGATSLSIPDPLAQAMAVASVVTELALAVGLWIPGLRWLVAVAGLGLHLSIPFVMDHAAPLVSFSIGVLVLYPLFFVARRDPEERPASVSA